MFRISPTRSLCRNATQEQRIPIVRCQPPHRVLRIGAVRRILSTSNGQRELPLEFRSCLVGLCVHRNRIPATISQRSSDISAVENDHPTYMEMPGHSFGSYRRWNASALLASLSGDPSQ